MYYAYKEYVDEFGAKVQIRFGRATNSVATAKCLLRQAGVGELRDQENRILAVRDHNLERWVHDLEKLL